MTDKEWDKFVKWIQEAHHLSILYTPDKTSINLWLEYERSKK